METPVLVDKLSLRPRFISGTASNQGPQRAAVQDHRSRAWCVVVGRSQRPVGYARHRTCNDLEVRSFPRSCPLYSFCRQVCEHENEHGGRPMGGIRHGLLLEHDQTSPELGHFLLLFWI